MCIVNCAMEVCASVWGVKTGRGGGSVNASRPFLYFYTQWLCVTQIKAVGLDTMAG